MDIGQWVHFSIDDVIESLKWVYQNQPESVFEEPMFGKLKEWHKKYELNCDLYVFEMKDGFKLTDLQDCYWKELSRESSWLKFGWHRRTAGKLSEPKEDIRSFRRTEELLEKKMGIKSLSKALRLHKWSAEPELLIQLKDFRIGRLLTSDNQQKSYDCSLRERDIIEQSGGCYARGFFYERTDIRFDYLDGQTSVEEFIDEAMFVIENLFMKNKVAAFVHEWKFAKVAEKIDEFWRMFLDVKKNIYPNAAAVVNNKIYFSASNEKNLYCFDINTKAVEWITHLPFLKKRLSPFESLCVYKDNIWMIPWMAVYILVYDINMGKVRRLHFPFDEEISKQIFKYRSHVVQGRFLWLLPAKYPKIIRIDMETTCDFEIFDKWPRGTLFNEESKLYFTMMHLHGNIIYLFNSGCNKSIMLDTISGQMSEWERGKDKLFGVVEKDCLYASPVHVNDKLEIIGNNFSETESVPECLWPKEEETYSYWYGKYAEGIVFFLPNEASGIIMKDIETKKTTFVTPDLTGFRSLRKNFVILDLTRFRSLKKNKVFSVYDIQSFQKVFLCIPYRGNMFLLFDRGGHITGRHVMQIPLSMLCNYEVTDYETEDYSVADFIRNISHLPIIKVKKAEEGNLSNGNKI